jgi:HPt (histidine-containing phosphotransfer) domain-containing protein
MASGHAGQARQAIAGRKPSSRPIDLVHLSHYTLGERELEHKLLQLFCTQSRSCLDQLREARSDKHWKEAAQSLERSARAVGAWRTAEAAEHAQGLAGGPLVRSRAARLGEIEACVAEAEAYIASLLNDR